MTTFLGLPAAGLGSGDIVIVGAGSATPYEWSQASAASAEAPSFLRAMSVALADPVDHWDFDLGGTMLGDAPVRVVDAGDIETRRQDPAGNRTRIAEAVRAIVAGGAVPIVLGGDDSIPIPVIAGFEGGAPLTIVQLDAHIDWRDDLQGVREGYSSTMRRASEMAWVARIVQIGQRGTGSARAEEVEAANAYGVTFVSARSVTALGAEGVLAHIPADQPVYLAVDADVLDPSIAPGVNAPCPGGLTFREAADLIQGLTRRCRIAGASFVELAPERDPTGNTAYAVTRLIRLLIGGIARNGQTGK